MSKETYMIECTTRDMISWLMNDYHYSLDKAMDSVYKSKTYGSLINVNTGLYFQSSQYVFEDLQKELSLQ